MATASMMLVAAASNAAAIAYDTVINFDDAPVLSATQQAGAWYTDRYAPAAFESAAFGGDNRLRLAIDGAQGSAGRGSSFAATFYNTHGRKLDLPTGTYAVEAKVHVPASWLDSGARRRSDLWATGFTAAGAVSSYPIIGFANVDGTPVLRAYNTITGDWIVIPGAPAADTWYTVGIQLEGGKVVYTLNGEEVASCPAPTTASLGNVIVQAYNFNDPALAPVQQSSDSYDAHWDDLSHAAAKVSIGANTYASVQAAVDAAAPGDVIELGSGVYDGAVVVNKDNLTIRAAAGATTKPRLQVTGATSALGTILVTSGTDGVTIEGLEILGLDGPAATEKAAIYFQGAHAGASIVGNTITANGDSALLTEYGQANTGFTISNNLFNGATFTGTAGGASNLPASPNQWDVANWPRPAVYMGSSATLSHFNITITGNEFAVITGDATNGNGLLLIDGGDVNISNNSFTGTSGARPGSELVRVRGTNSDVTGNTFSGSASIAVNVGGTANDTPATSEVTGNVFTGAFTAKVVNASAGVLNATLNFWGDASRPTTPEDFVGNVAALPYFKDAALTAVGPVRVGSTGYASIQGAIDAAATVAGDTVTVDAGTFLEDVTVSKDITLQGAGAGSSIISGPIGGGNSTVRLTASGSTVDGFTITREGNADWTNGSLNLSGVAIQGQATTGVTISNNLITGNRTAIDINHSNGNTVGNNVITANHTGLVFRNQTDNTTVTENEIVANRTVGILFLAADTDGDPVQSAVGSSFTNNNISGNWYGQVVDRQAGGSIPAPGTTNGKNFEKNWFGSTAPVVTTNNSAEPGYNDLNPATAVQPSGQPDIAGAASANIDFAPLLASGTDTDLAEYGFQGNLTSTVDTLIGDVEIDEDTEPFEDLFIPAGTTVTVPTGTTLEAETFNLSEGATLEVTGGSLTIGSGTSTSTITGSFTIFNSFGSLNINGNTTFSVSQSLALVADIHVADGVTLSVNGGGELILDGCVIDCQTAAGSYNITTATNGLLTMARNVVTDAVITVDTLIAGSQIYDNRFVDSTIDGSSATARVYHNILEGTSSSSLSTSVDGWANVTDASGLKNLLTLDFDAPASSDRTLIDGNLFVRPGDSVVMALNVSDLDAVNKIVTAEALIGYSSNLLGVASPQTTGQPVAAEPGWQIITNTGSQGGGLGLADSALGLEFAEEGAEGSNADSRIGKVTFTALDAGITTGFFRVQTDRQYDDNGDLVKDTRLTRDDSVFLSPFTSNAGELIIDDEIPVISGAAATQSQPSVSPAVTNYLGNAANIVRGSVPVTLSFTATDAGLAGIDTRDQAGAIPTNLSLASDLLIEAKSGVNTLALSNLVVSGGPTGAVNISVDLAVPATTPVGTYTVTAKILDRAGNDSGVTTLGTLEIANEARVKVDIHGFQGASREIVFVATGGAPKTWTKTVAFTDTDPTAAVKMLGEVVLEDVPAGTTAISAKSAWTIRKKLTTAFSAQGYGETNFVQALPTDSDNRLKGGDLNGDNVINTLDYGVLRAQFNSTTNPTADIDGNGAVNVTDFNIMQSNFYKLGDAQ